MVLRCRYYAVEVSPSVRRMADHHLRRLQARHGPAALPDSALASAHSALPQDVRLITRDHIRRGAERGGGASSSPAAPPAGQASSSWQLQPCRPLDAHSPTRLRAAVPGLAACCPCLPPPPARARRSLGRIDLLCSGFPCQDLSRSNRGAQLGLRGARSGLFFQAAQILEWVKEVNPDVVFLFENGGPQQPAGREAGGLQTKTRWLPRGVHPAWRAGPCPAAISHWAGVKAVAVGCVPLLQWT